MQTGTVAVAAHVHDLVLVIRHEVVEGNGQLVLLHLLLHLLELCGLVGLAPHDVKLAAARLLVRVYLVAQTGCTQSATLVEECGADLCLNGVVGTASAELLALGSTLAVGVAALYHEIFYHAVKQRAVIVALLCELHDVVTVLGCLVVKAHNDVAF